MHIHILGICGTFMGGIAAIAREAGHKVTGCDAGVYPPMSTQLESQGIDLIEGYAPEQIGLNPDVFVVGNVVSRGNPLMEEILNRGLPYLSGPQWLAENVLRGRWVLAVAGTHGKTTTSAMLAWILEHAGLAPGFLIGGVPLNFGVSARLTDSAFFVIEADEYDTAFFDKRAKFVHYRPRTAILNNLEMDHADIFADLAAIQKTFSHFIRIVPRNGLLLGNGDDPNLAPLLDVLVTFALVIVLFVVLGFAFVLVGNSFGKAERGGWVARGQIVERLADLGQALEFIGARGEWRGGAADGSPDRQQACIQREQGGQGDARQQAREV